MDAPPQYGLVGWPLAHSLSPAMHRAAFEALGIDGEYRLLPTAPEDLGERLAALERGELAGVNVTVPFKTAVLAELPDASELAIGIGAVNTIVRGEQGLRGENTDGVGFRHALEVAGLLDGRGKQALVLGAGGAARAVAYVLLRAGYSVTVRNRSSARSGVLVAQLYRAMPGAPISTGRLDPDPARLVEDARGVGLLVNATPVGAAKASPKTEPGSSVDSGGEFETEPAAMDSLWPLDVPIPAGMRVIDLVAWPLETPLVRHARACGAQAEGGLEMLVAQAARAFKLWTGTEPALELMRSAALAAAGVVERGGIGAAADSGPSSPLGGMPGMRPATPSANGHGEPKPKGPSNRSGARPSGPDSDA